MVEFTLDVEAAVDKTGKVVVFAVVVGFELGV